MPLQIDGRIGRYMTDCLSDYQKLLMHMTTEEIIGYVGSHDACDSRSSHDRCDCRCSFDVF